jgi:translation initiation factor eIF-2B subunit epsilon
VYENAVVTGSVIGKRCVIGPGARIANAYIFDDTTVGAGASVERSIVGNKVIIGPNSVISKGCLIGDHVVLGKHAELRPFERLSTKEAAEEALADDSDEEEEVMDEAGKSALALTTAAHSCHPRVAADPRRGVQCEDLANGPHQRRRGHREPGVIHESAAHAAR